MGLFCRITDFQTMNTGTAHGPDWLRSAKAGRLANPILPSCDNRTLYIQIAV